MPHLTPSDLPFPALMLNFPFTVRTDVANNILMEPCKWEVYDYSRAFQQFFDFYRALSHEALIYLLPSKGDFQDQTYVANLGMYFPCLDESTIILSQFKSKPRVGEDEIGRAFFEDLGYKVIQPAMPMTFEGEADIKYIRDNIAIGGHGIRTSETAHRWIEEQTETEIVSIEMRDEELYHFDCILLRLTPYKALVVTSAISPRDLKKIERVLEVVDIPTKYKYSAWSNSLTLNGKVFHSPVFKDSGSDFKDFITKLGLEPVLVDLSEFEKSGAGLSCMTMHLNYKF